MVVPVRLSVLFCLVPAVFVVTVRGGPSFSSGSEGGKTVFQLESPAFPAEGTIPRQYTCDGADLSPPLRWHNVPAGTTSFALIVDDPDAPGGTFTHWLLWGLSPDRRDLPEGLPSTGKIEDLDDATQGTNDFGRTGYGGPCPPPGPAHRYQFQLYALDTAIAIEPASSKSALLQAMEGHIVEKTVMTGRYSR